MGSIKKVNGVPWADGVIANCLWGGVRLSDVLKFLGVASQVSSHVCFASFATLCEDDDYYGASIPLESALDDSCDILLAYEVSYSRLHTTPNLMYK